LTGLTPGSTVSIDVKAINSLGNKSASISVQLAPSNITSFLTSSITQTGFTLSWSGGTGATTYTYTNNGSSITPFTNDGVSNKTAVFSGLNAGSSNSIVVTATNSSGSTSSSSFTVQLVPSNITGVASSLITSTGFKISWSGGTGATSYTYKLNGSLTTASDDQGVSSRNATFSGLTAETTYTVIIDAVNTNGTTQSTPFDVTTVAAAAISSLAGGSDTSSGIADGQGSDALFSNILDSCSDPVTGDIYVFDKIDNFTYLRKISNSGNVQTITQVQTTIGSRGYVNTTMHFFNGSIYFFTSSVSANYAQNDPFPISFTYMNYAYVISLSTKIQNLHFTAPSFILPYGYDYGYMSIYMLFRMDNQGNFYMKAPNDLSIIFRARDSTSFRYFDIFTFLTSTELFHGGQYNTEDFIVDANYNVYTNFTFQSALVDYTKYSTNGGRPPPIKRFTRQGVLKDIPVGQENDSTARNPLNIREKSNFPLRPYFRLAQDSSRLYSGGLTRSIAIELDDPVATYAASAVAWNSPQYLNSLGARIKVPDYFNENSVFQGDLRLVSPRSVYKINTIVFNMNPPTALTNITVSEIIYKDFYAASPLSFKLTWLGGDGASFYRFASGNVGGEFNIPNTLNIYITPLSDDTVSSRTATFSEPNAGIGSYVVIYAINLGGVVSSFVNF
jgi:hypothetical protein